MKFIDVGGGNSVLKSRIVAIVSFDAAPIKRLVQDAKEKGTVIDATCGRKCLSVIITDSRHVILSSLTISSLTDTEDTELSGEQ